MSDFITLSSGRTIYANRGIVGISPELTITEGYDGSVSWPPEDGADEAALTADDMRELADLMIERWTRFKEQLP